MTTRAKVMHKGSFYVMYEDGNDREGSGGVGTLNVNTQQQPSRTTQLEIHPQTFTGREEVTTHAKVMRKGPFYSYVMYYPQPEIGSETTLRSTGKKRK